MSYVVLLYEKDNAQLHLVGPFLNEEDARNYGRRCRHWEFLVMPMTVPAQARQ